MTRLGFDSDKNAILNSDLIVSVHRLTWIFAVHVYAVEIYFARYVSNNGGKGNGYTG